MSVPTVRYGSTQVIFESYPTVGFNYRMTDIQAASGANSSSACLRSSSSGGAWPHYADLAADIPGLAFPAEPSWARSNWQSYCVRLPKGLDQRSVMQALLDKGSSTRRGIMCSHRGPPTPNWHCARNCHGPSRHRTSASCCRCMRMSDREQLEVVDALREAVLRR